MKNKLLAILLLLMVGSAGFSFAQSISTSTVACYTDAAGNIKGLPNPLTTPVISANSATGTLSAGFYYVKLFYVDGLGNVSLASPEATYHMLYEGSLIVAAPTIQPTAAVGYTVGISATAGDETIQGSVTGWTSFTQSAPLATGAALPSSNNSVCSVYFSDQLIPTGTGYQVAIHTQSGSAVPGYPQTWCLYGGANGTMNVTQGLPSGDCGNNGVFYPTPLLANVTNAQSVAGSFTVGGDLTVGGTLYLNNQTITGTLTVGAMAVNSLLINGNTLTAAPGTAVITLPATTTTLIGADTTEVLSNKTLATPIISAPTITGGTSTGMTETSNTYVSPVINTGIAQGTGFKHQRITTGAITASTTTPVTWTWTLPFGDADYTPVCSVTDASNFLAIVRSLSALTANGFTINVQNTDSANDHTGTLNCIGIHD